MRRPSEPTDWTLAQAVAHLRALRISPAAYREALAVRTREHAHLNAYLSEAFHTALDEVTPENPLFGVLLAVKDNIDVAGVRTTAGTPALRRHLPSRSSTVWERCARAGAALAGKTALHELAYGITGHHALGPPSLNPSAPDHLAGGSSSGTAAAVAARLVPAGLGTDTGGSVRIPAALCGVIGYRPTLGRYPADGVVRVSTSRDTVGVMTRDVHDARLLDRVLAGPHARAATPLRRVPRAVLPAPLWEDLDPQVEHVCRAACERLSVAGWELVERALPGFSWHDVLRSATLVPAHETRCALAGYLTRHPGAPEADDVLRAVSGEDVRDLVLPLLGGGGPDRTAYEEALNTARLLASRLDFLRGREEAHVLLAPATTLPAPGKDVGAALVRPSGEASTFLTYIRNTAVAAVTGSPSITVPAGHTASGLPVGLLLDAAPSADTMLLDVAERAADLLTGRGSA
ncbi:amidase [Streptomyces californicus]|uniref:Amidase n=1 Tax=Streptomyces californicus TaxID=67351 RepID=A0ABX7IVW9_9ACTN|nr:MULTISPECIES: amidase family protein [Streptomyces]QRV26253.1 amidase [Streptomyces californicus]QRV39655.1 amidase [Streptomyces californicus]